MDSSDARDALRFAREVGMRFPEEIPAKVEYREVMMSFEGFNMKALYIIGGVNIDNKIPVIKEIRAKTGVGLKEAKDVSEGTRPLAVSSTGEFELLQRELKSSAFRLIYEIR